MDFDQDNQPTVVPLRPDRPSGAPLQPDLEVVETLQDLLTEVLSGKIIGFALVAFDAQGNQRFAAEGKVTFSQAIGGLELLKFDILTKWSAKNDGRPLL